MQLESLSAWLLCPHCRQPLSPSQPLTLRCDNGHSFDVNKRGFVNLLGPRPTFTGDAADMLDARDRFLDRGHYEEIRSALVAALAQGANASGTDKRVIDAGCGTGYYLEGVLSANPNARALAFDVSAAAVARSVRRSSGAANGLLADTWSPLPIRSGIADALYAVFAPRNLPEFHRILAAGGELVVVVPSVEHLRELRGAGGNQALDVPADKAEQLAQLAQPLFALQSSQRVEYVIELEAFEARALVQMGPAGHHRSSTELDTVLAGSATVSVDIVRFARVD